MNCHNCERDFKPKRADALYCSPRCRKQAQRAAKRDSPVPDSRDKPPPVTDPDVTAPRAPILRSRESMLIEAKRLTALQVEERGIVDYQRPDGKMTKVVGPYKSTPEREARAARILQLRRMAAA